MNQNGGVNGQEQDQPNQISVRDCETTSTSPSRRLILNRVWAMPNRYPFIIPPIAALVARYVSDGKGWIDPFAGMYSPAEITNDLNPKAKAQYHLDALDFLKGLKGQYQGILFDPPYSYHQMQECYEEIGIGKITSRHATNFYGDLRDAIAPLIVPGGLALSFGWNSIGMGKTHGFEIIEILLVCHGRAHNDTICTVERKIQGNLREGW